MDQEIRYLKYALPIRTLVCSPCECW